MIEKEVCSVRTPVVGIPEEIQIIPHGRHKTAKGFFSLDADGAKEVLESFSMKENQMAIDYEHQSLSGSEAPAAGWITRLIDKGREGLWAEVEWTRRAREFLANREYRYLSPVFLKEAATGRVVRLLGAGLTNRPAIDGMVPVVNTEGFPLSDQKEDMGMEDLFKALGLGADATEKDAVESVKALREKSERAVSVEVVEALGLKEGATLSEVVGTAMALRRGHELAGELAARVEELVGQLKSTEAEGLVASAMREGKLTPAQEGWGMEFAGRDPEGFLTFVAKAPSVIRFGEMGLHGAMPTGARAMDETQRMVNQLCGVSEELFVKHSG